MKIKILIFLILLCAVSSRVSSQTYSPTDSLALVAIDNSCDTSDSLNWDTEPDPGNWDGVIWNDENPKRVVQLDISSKSLTGAMDVSSLISLTDLQCSYNQLTSIDVSTLTNLISLNCNINQLTALDVSELTGLNSLCCNSNGLTNLNVSTLLNLNGLYCANNQLTSLDVSTLVNLTGLYCSDNQLTNLNVSALINLNWMDCSNNQLTSLDVSALTNLTQLYCSENQLTGLDVSELTNLNYFYCYSNQLTDLNVSALVNLVKLYCSINPLGELDVSALTNLTFLSCYANELTILDISTLTSLTTVVCCSNQITELDLSALTNLAVLICNDNQITSLDVSELINMTGLHCFGNQLTELDASALLDLEYLECYNNRLPFSSLATGLHVVNFSYIPQDIIFEPYVVSVDVILDYSAEALIDGTATQFIFYKDDVEVETNTTGLFNTTGAGVYYCQMTNTKFPGLTLTTAGVTVTGESPVLELSVSSLNVGADANSTATFDVMSNTSWDVTSSQNWLTVDPESGMNSQTVTVTAEENPDETARDATVTVSGTGVTPKTVLVTQEGNDISSFYVVNNYHVILYPNPVADKLTIRLSENDLPSMTGIYTMDGKELIFMENKASTFEIDMGTLQPGIYILKIITPGSSIAEEIIKL